MLKDSTLSDVRSKRKNKRLAGAQVPGKAGGIQTGLVMTLPYLAIGAHLASGYILKPGRCLTGSDAATPRHFYATLTGAA